VEEKPEKGRWRVRIRITKRKDGIVRLQDKGNIGELKEI
jgi:hypothetical protein